VEKGCIAPSHTAPFGQNASPSLPRPALEHPGEELCVSKLHGSYTADVALDVRIYPTMESADLDLDLDLDLHPFSTFKTWDNPTYICTLPHLARQNSCLCPTLRLSPASAMRACRPPSSSLTTRLSWTAPSASQILESGCIPQGSRLPRIVPLKSTGSCVATGKEGTAHGFKHHRESGRQPSGGGHGQTV